MQDGVTGVLVRDSSDEAFASALQTLVRDERTRCEMAANAHRAVRDGFTMPVVAEQYIDFFETLINNGRAKPVAV